MNTSFSSNSKIWIFQSVEYLDLNDCSFIKEKMIEFIQSWDSHGKILKSEYDILYSHFILVTCDNMINEPSGCAIDKLFNQIKAGSKGGNAGEWSARKAQMLAKKYKAAGGGYKSKK